MIIFLDTSAWIKYFIEEKGTTEIQKFILDKSSSVDNSFSASAVTYAEIYATIKRALKGERITEEQFNRIKNEFEKHCNMILHLLFVRFRTQFGDSKACTKQV